MNEVKSRPSWNLIVLQGTQVITECCNKCYNRVAEGTWGPIGGSLIPSGVREDFPEEAKV